jgi:hypothetical protein
MSAQRSRALSWLLPLILVLAVVCVVVIVIAQRRAGAYKPPPLAFDGPSDELEQTVIVTGLDRPMSPDINVIWCASFQLAWNQLRDEIVGEPIRIANAEETVEGLNNAKTTKDDVEPGSCYAKAGAVSRGVIERIQRDMARLFPSAPKPEIEASKQALVAYAYLAANVKFTIPFFESEEGAVFGGTRVSAFGIAKKHEYAYYELREQIDVLYVERDASDKDPKDREFVIDPCKDSSPNQIILAHIRPKGSLAATLEYLDSKLAGCGDSGYEHEFTPRDELLVPNIAARIQHRFSQLEGPDMALLNGGFEGYWVAVAAQSIQFRLDRTGAELRAEAKAVCVPDSRRFYFDRPFLIVMKKRGAERPFFVMWVANAELLCKR